jgi:hypothetical protein
MARLLRIAAAAVAAAILVSCVTTVDGVWISGRVHDVSENDIRQAIAACRRNDPMRKDNPRQIEVVSRDEIYVYWFERKAVDPSHSTAKRVRGRWTCEERVIVVVL